MTRPRWGGARRADTVRDYTAAVTSSSSLPADLPEDLYAELRRAAGALMRDQGRAQTLQPTVLVHEAWVRLSGQPDRWNDEAHFLAAAARTMRFVLADHARGKGSLKRGADARRITLSDDVGMVSPGIPIGALDLDDALTRLEQLHERQARVAEMRFLAGLTIDECARVLGVSHGTVESDWRLARAWLQTSLTP